MLLPVLPARQQIPNAFGIVQVIYDSTFVEAAALDPAGSCCNVFQDHFRILRIVISWFFPILVAQLRQALWPRHSCRTGSSIFILRFSCLPVGSIPISASALPYCQLGSWLGVCLLDCRHTMQVHTYHSCTLILLLLLWCLRTPHQLKKQARQPYRRHPRFRFQQLQWYRSAPVHLA